MADKIKGITIEIGGETQGLTKALGKVNKEVGATQKELKQVERLLKLDPKNTQLLAQKQELLSKNINTTKEKLDALKKAQKETDEQIKNGTNINQNQYRKLQQEIVQTEENLKRLNLESSKLNKFSKDISDVGSSMTNAGKKGMIFTAAVAGAGAVAVNSASDMSESLNKVDVAFKNDADTVKKWSETTLDSYGIAKGSALDMAALFGDMGTAMGIPTNKAADMSTSLVGLAGDLASFKNVSLDVAQNALKGIFTGEGESLKSLGVIMQDTTLKEYALANGYKTKYENMSQAEKVQLRYNYVMEQTKNAQGDFANTADGTANSLRVFTESLKELSAEFGEKLLPLITPIIQKLTELTKWFGNLSDGQQKIILTITLITALIPPLLILLGNTCTAIGAVTGAIAKFSAAASVGSKASAALGATVTAIPFLIAAAAIPYYVSQIYSLATTTKDVTDAHEKAIKAIDDTASSEMAEAEKAIILKDRLYELEDQINSSSTSEAEAKILKEEHSTVVDQLNSMIPDLTKHIGNESNGYRTQKGEVDALTQSFYDLAYAKAMANAYEAKMTETASRLIEVKGKQKEYTSKFANPNKTDMSALNRTVSNGLNPIGAKLEDPAPSSIAFLSMREQVEYRQYVNLEKQLTDEMNGYISELSKYSQQASEKAKKSVKDDLDDLLGGIKNTGSGATKSVKSNAKKQTDIKKEQYDEDLRNLKYSHEMGEISDEEYYKRLEEIRDTYFEIGSKEWQDHTLEIHRYIESQKDEVKKLYDEMAEHALTRIDDIADAQKSFADNLKNYGKLFTTETLTFVGMGENGKDYVTTRTELTDLNKTVTTLNKYRDILNKIREKGVPKGFFTVLRGLSVDEGIAFGDKLLSVPDEEFNSYVDSWQNYQNVSDDISRDLYSGEMAELSTEITSEFSDLKDKFSDFGFDSADEWCNGFISKLETMKTKILSALPKMIMSDSGYEMAGYSKGSTVYSNTDNRKSTSISITNNGGTQSAYEQRQQIKRLFNELELQGG